MNAELQGIEVERAILRDDDFAVKHAASGQLGAERLEQFRKVAVQRFFVATLDQDLVPVTKHQGTKPIPFRFEEPCSGHRQFTYPLGEHRQNRRVHRKIHILVFYSTRSLSTSQSCQSFQTFRTFQLFENRSLMMDTFASKRIAISFSSRCT